VVAQLGWLKARLTWNGLRRDRQRRIGFPLILGLMTWLAWKIASSYKAEFGRLEASLGAELALWGALAFFIGWVTLPVVIFPLDETLDPARLATFPITRPKLLAGLILASLISPSILVPATAATVNASLFSGWARVAAVVAGMVLLAQMAVGAHLFTSLVSAILRSRRGRDLAVMVVIAIGLFTFAAYQTVASQISASGMAGALSAHRLSGVAALIPPVAAQSIVTKSAAGDWGGAVLMLVAALAWLGLMAYAWDRLLGWMLVTPDHSPRPDRARHRRGLAERGPWGKRLVLARKELRFFVRDPRQRLVWTGTVIFVGLAVAVLVVGTDSMAIFRRSTWLPLLAPAMVLFVGLPIALNQFGWERNASSYLFVLPIKPRHLLHGKNLAIALGLVLETVFMSILLATFSGAWDALLMVPALAVAAIGCQLAVGNLVSVVAPLRLPREGTDVFAQATEQGLLALLAQMGSFLMIGLLLVPPSVGVVLAVAFGRVLDPALVTGFCVLYGLAVYFIALWLAGILLRRRVPEVVAWVQVQ
jgi:ABC-2 type transport system permease protein